MRCIGLRHQQGEHNNNRGALPCRLLQHAVWGDGDDSGGDAHKNHPLLRATGDALPFVACKDSPHAPHLFRYPEFSFIFPSVPSLPNFRCGHLCNIRHTT
ncbi:hypothetical protein Vafri_21846 [Volvox africanus]|uniref:Uncharacterized protein n=1 Tax=Volvox africanus TaxID=51714 RepID=A0A8J4FAV6_9CHLO|nr:hypothetical protein Vafri_21846 [Volvox africanus]